MEKVFAAAAAVCQVKASALPQSRSCWASVYMFYPQLDSPGSSPKTPRSHNLNVSDLSPASAACWCWGHSGTAPMPLSPEHSRGAGLMQAAAPLVPPCLYHLTPLTFKRWEISCNSAEQPYKAAVTCICKNNLCLLEKKWFCSTAKARISFVSLFAFYILLSFNE